METANPSTDKRRNFSRWFTRRIVNYVVICGFLAILNYRTLPQYWWVAWVAAGWGIDLILSLVWHLTDCGDECCDNGVRH